MSESSLYRVPTSAEPEMVTELGFSDDFKIDWDRSTIDPALLADLMQRDDLRGWLQTLGHLGYFFFTCLLYTSPSPRDRG